MMIRIDYGSSDGKYIGISLDEDTNINEKYLCPSYQNGKYIQYTNVLGGEEYRKYVALLVGNIINSKVSDTLITETLKSIYDTNSLDDYKNWCERYKLDYAKNYKVIYTLAKNKEIQDIYNGIINRFEEVLNNNIYYIFFNYDNK